MGLMDRDYMNKTPEERETERLIEKQHRNRLNEMGYLMSKGENLTRSERKRLEQIYEENRAYMNGERKLRPVNQKKKSNFMPVIIFTIIIIFLILIFSFYPDLTNFNIWEFIGH
ncbi:hypothetical protein DW049_14040 [Ruminococcus sp. AF41-9]|nr:hypothetical protein DW049_14040 [Ruminococcus sp. AF41-9]